MIDADPLIVWHIASMTIRLAIWGFMQFGPHSATWVSDFVMSKLGLIIAICVAAIGAAQAQSIGSPSQGLDWRKRNVPNATS